MPETIRPAHHLTMPPSAAPWLCICPRFVPRGDSQEDEDAAEGTRLHELFSQALLGTNKSFHVQEEEIPDTDETELIRWARDYVFTRVIVLQPTGVEILLPICEPDGREITFGHADYVHDEFDRVLVFDLKSGHQEYNCHAQLNLYALGAMQRFKVMRAECHVVRPRLKTAMSWEIEYGPALDQALEIERAIADQDSPHVPCDGCAYCKRALDVACPALNERALAVAGGREDWPPLENYHASQICNARDMAKALTLADHMEDWISGVKYQAREMILKNGAEIPGRKLQRRVTRSCPDIMGAYARLGLAPDEFIGACSMSLPNVEKAVAAKEKLSTAKAKAVVSERLAGLIESKESFSIVKDRKSKITQGEIVNANDPKE